MLYFHYGELFFHIHCSCIYCSLCLFMVSFLEFSSLLNLECVLRYSLRVESIVLKINILLSQIYLLLLSFCTDWRWVIYCIIGYFIYLQNSLLPAHNSILMLTGRTLLFDGVYLKLIMENIISENILILGFNFQSCVLFLSCYFPCTVSNWRNILLIDLELGRKL